MNDLAKYLFLLSIFVLVCFTGKTAFAATIDTDATCAIDCTVDGQVEWKSDFTAISIVAHLTYQGEDIVGTGTTMLWTNGDVTLTTAGAGIAQLVSDPADTLVTEYKLVYDADGQGAETGGATVDYALHTAFMTSGSAVTHKTGDGAVGLTLSVRATFDTDNVANADDYTATQTITAAWP